MDLFWTSLSWIAILVVSVSYWLQVWHIHKHKEVRDLSMSFYVMFLFGITLLCIQAYRENSVIFFVKQILVIIPVVIIIFQIIYHRQDHWHDDNCDFCVGCSAEMETHWDCCPYCGCDQTADFIIRVYEACQKNGETDSIEYALKTRSY